MHGRFNLCSISNESQFIFPDNYGIIRDIVQNHLLQVLTLLAMEPPTKADGPSAGESIRNAKVQVLNAIPPITMDECFLGQYEGTIYNVPFHNEQRSENSLTLFSNRIHR
jgi:glucose-6-phosphate 1-dehydrogenase